MRVRVRDIKIEVAIRLAIVKSVRLLAAAACDTLLIVLAESAKENILGIIKNARRRKIQKKCDRSTQTQRTCSTGRNS